MERWSLNEPWGIVAGLAGIAVVATSAYAIWGERGAIIGGGGFLVLTAAIILLRRILFVPETSAAERLQRETLRREFLQASQLAAQRLSVVVRARAHRPSGLQVSALYWERRQEFHDLRNRAEQFHGEPIYDRYTHLLVAMDEMMDIAKQHLPYTSIDERLAPAKAAKEAAVLRFAEQAEAYSEAALAELRAMSHALKP